MTPPLSLGRFAELHAYTSEYPERDHVVILERLGVSPEAWEAARAHWPRYVAAALEAGDADPMLECAATLGRIRKAIRLWRWPLADIRPDEMFKAAPPPVAAPPRQKRPLPPKEASPTPSAIAAPTGGQVPSYLRDGPGEGWSPTEPPKLPDAAAARPRTDVSTTSMGVVTGVIPTAALGVGAVPFRPADPARAAPPPAPAPPKPRIDTGTALADGPLVDFSNLPLARSKRAAEPPPPTSDPNWTLGRFVELTVALAATPDRGSALARFGLNEESHRAVATEWGGRITSDPALRLRFDELVRAKRTQGT